MTTVTLYGIANCDTIRKARHWLERHGVAFDFHDYRKQGLDPALLGRFADELGWEALLNRRGTTWRKLPEEVRERIDRRRALAAMLDNPALIRRPILARDDSLHLGFSESQYRDLFDRA